MSKFYNPDGKIDGSLGTVMRLNILWARVDKPAAEGDFDKWDYWLDRIFCNLCYKEPFEIEKNEGKIVEVKFNSKDKELFEYLNLKVAEARQQLKNSKSKEDYTKAKGNFYKALMMKDIGLRKYEHQVLRVYMKHIDTNPARAMWGG
jgi:hypothetical protein